MFSVLAEVSAHRDGICVRSSAWRRMGMRSPLPVVFLTVCLLPSNTFAQGVGTDPVSNVPPNTRPANAKADPIFDIDTLKKWEQCREYLPYKKSQQCRIYFDMTQTKDIRIPPQTHKDITVYLSPGSRGVVVLWHSSPFAACSLSTNMTNVWTFICMYSHM